VTTRAELRAAIREVLSDRGTWPDATLNIWINAAIRDYNSYFQQVSSASIDCVASTRSYSLATLSGIQGLLQVEYPAGETPPRFLERRPETGNFYGLPVYDLRGDPPATLVIGELPEAGETISVVYSLDYETVSDDSTALGVPDRHLDGLVAFVRWQAIQELEMSTAIDPDTKNLLLEELGVSVGRAEQLYRAKIRSYQRAAAPGGYAGPWQVDGHDRIY
jgi:hypothetical protein